MTTATKTKDGSKRRKMFIWQVKALQNGRNPLPNSPNNRPWKLMNRVELRRAMTDVIEKHNQTPAERKKRKLAEGTRRKLWTKAESMYLFLLKVEDEKNWHQLAALFPHRSIWGLKQAWRKLKNRPGHEFTEDNIMCASEYSLLARPIKTVTKESRAYS